MQKDVLDVVVVFSSSSSNPKDVAFISYAAPNALSKDRVQAIVTQAMTKQREETQELVNQAIMKQREEMQKEVRA